MTRLKCLARKLITELELAEHERVDDRQLQPDFYEDVTRFEIELITTALIRSKVINSRLPA